MDKKNCPKVFMYSGEYEKIVKLVLGKPDIETGGDLFGLWVNESTVVLQVVTGPGKNCERATHSFFQDIAYLSSTGNQLTKREGLCNVGEWHSHHRLGLPVPSGGDRNTVWKNLPKLGLQRFLLLIANIRGNEVNLGAFLFESKTKEMVTIDITKLNGASPFRSKDSVIKILELGKEVEDNGVQKEPVVVNSVDKETLEANQEMLGEEAGNRSTPRKLTKSEKKKLSKNKNKSTNQNVEQPSDGGKLEPSQKISSKANESSKSINSGPSKTPQPAVVQEIRPQTNQQPKYSSKKKQKNKRQVSKTPTKIIPSLHNPTHINASEIIEFTGALCKELKSPAEFTVHNDELFELSVEITRKNGSGISLSVSKNSSEHFPEIRMSNKNGIAQVEKLSSWPVTSAENRKMMENLRKKLKTMKTEEAADRGPWLSYIINTAGKIVQTILIVIVCVLLIYMLIWSFEEEQIISYS